MMLTKEELRPFYERIEKLMAVNPRGFRRPSMKRGRIFVTWITQLAMEAFELTPEPVKDVAPDSKKGKSWKRWHLRQKPPIVTEFDETVSELTNWQRKRWARAGYPGLRKKEAAKVAPFLEMRRAA